MTTLSLLKNIEEFKEAKIRFLPFEKRGGHKYEGMDWALEEYTKYSKQYADFNEALHKFTMLFFKSFITTCKSKERLLSTIKAIDVSFYGRIYKLTSKAPDVVNQLIKVLKTGECEESFQPGKRLHESLKQMKYDLSDEHWTIAETLLIKALEAHLDIHYNYWLKQRFIPLEEYQAKRTHEPLDYLIPETIRENPLVKTLSQKMIELGLAIDDYYVTKHKIISNDMTSRVFSYLNEKGCSLQEGFDNQYEFVMDLNKQCEELKNKINSNPELSSDGLTDWMNTAYNFNYAFFKFLEVSYQFKVKADKTIESVQWDKFYDEMRSKIVN